MCTSFLRGRLEQVHLQKPLLDSVPPMQRRRLGSLARVVFHVLEQCRGAHRNETVLFSSGMGEIQRTQGILEAIAAGEPVSPAAFSLSVHNGIAGQWSLVHDVREPLLAIAAPDGSPVPALLEASGHLAEGAGDGITVVCYEEPLPDFYRPFIRGPSAPAALALRLSADTTQGQVLSIRPAQAAATDTGPGFAALVDLLHGRVDSMVLAEPRCNWELKLAA